MSDENLTKIPDGWAFFTLTDICIQDKNAIKRGPFGSAIKKAFFVPSGYKVYQQKNAIYNDFKFGDYYINDEKFEELKNFEVEPGDIIMSCSGTVGRLAVVPEDAERGVINQALLKLTLSNEVVDTKYFLYLFRYKIDQILLNNLHGSAMKNIASVRELKKFLFPMPPKNEQKRIVSKIDELFTNLDAGINELEQTKEKLKKYRRSVLKYAFEGKLTEKWREFNKDEIEPAHLLVEGINKEEKNKKLPKLNSLELPKLPESWIWTDIDTLSTKVNDGVHQTPTYVDQGIPFISVNNMSEDGSISFANCKYISKGEHKELYKRCNPQKGDILLSKVGTVGLTATVNTDVEFSLFVNTALIKPLRSIVYADYLRYAIRNGFLSGWYNSYISGSTQKFIGTNKIKSLAIPLASIKEQKFIIDEIDKIFTVISEFEAIINQSLKKSQILRQSILKKAFEGKLIQQNPADEPAEKLLKRITAERAKKKIKSKKKTVKQARLA